MAIIAPGTPVPEFTLKTEDLEDFTRADLEGRTSVLVFFPAAFSPVCSSELARLKESWPGLDRADVELVTISCDPMFSLRAYSDQARIDFPMLSDFWPHGEVSTAYGVFDRDFGCSKRSTFIVDQESRVRWLVHSAMPDPRSFDDYVGALDFLNAR